MPSSICQGCGGAASAFQCPLCQAEGITDAGFFCGQECFATNWLQHRDTLHKSGVVRERRKTATATTSETPASKEAATSPNTLKSGRARAEAKESPAVERKRTRTTDVDVETPAVQQPKLSFDPWPVIAPGEVGVAPALSSSIPRAVIACGGDADPASVPMWPAIRAASHHIATLLAEHPHTQVLVAAGSPASAHAFAWASRGEGLGGRMRLVVEPLPRSTDAEEAAAPPSAIFTRERPVVVATTFALRHSADADASPDAASGVASLWFSSTTEALLITLPDVEDADDLQGLHHRALFFAHRAKTAGKKLPPASAWSAEEEVKYELTKSSATMPVWKGEDLHRQYHLMKDAAESGSSTETAVEVVGAAPTHFHLDNDVATCLANGDLLAALQHLVRVYSTEPGHFEALLFHSLCCDWGAITVAHAHHRLAYILRHLIDHASRFKAKKGISMTDAALRAILPLCKLLPPLRTQLSSSSDESPSKKRKTTQEAEPATISEVEKQRYTNYYNTLPNLQLQATLFTIIPLASPVAVDALAACWGIDRYLHIPDGLKSVQQPRKELVQRIRSRYGAKVSSGYVEYLIVLMHLIYDTVAIYSLTLEELEQRLLWNFTLGYDLGKLETFLMHVQLLPTPATQGSKAATTAPSAKGASPRSLSSRQTETKKSSPEQNRIAEMRSHAVHTQHVSDYVALSWKSLPLTGTRAREVAELHRMAVEEVLMAMPRQPRPMYVGEVGNLVGKWFHFNARFDGVLGVSLADFMHQHPEAFQVVGTLVTRKHAGKGDQVRIRFDEDHLDSGEDSDDEGRKKRDREMLTGRRAAKARKEKLEKELPSRARKKRAVQDFNKSRFNRNYKQIDPSARVPGYVKHGPKKIKGRGTKANKRLVKRG